MNIAPATPVLFATPGPGLFVMPGSGIAPGPTEGHIAAFSTLLAGTPPMGPLPQAVPSIEGVAAALTSRVSNAEPLPLAPVAREPIGALRAAPALADNEPQAPDTLAAMVTLPAPDPIQPSVPVVTVTADLAAASAPRHAERRTGPTLSYIVVAKGMPRSALASAPAAAAASPGPDPQRSASDDEISEAGLSATAAVIDIALPVSVLPQAPLPVTISASVAPPGIKPAQAVALPADTQPAGASPMRSDLLSQRRPGVALVAAGPVPSLANGTRSAAMPDRSLSVGSRIVTPAPVSPVEITPWVAVPPDAATSAVPPLSDVSSDAAAAAIDTPRAAVSPPAAAVSNGRDTSVAAATMPHSHSPATASVVDRRGRPILRDRTDAPAPLAINPGDIAPGLVLAKDGTPIAATPRDAASPVKTMVELPTETAIMTDRFGTVQIAVEGTATDVKVSLALAPMAVLAPADAQRLASGLAADLAATGVRLQSLDISGGDSGRGGSPQGQRDPNSQRPLRPPPSSQRLPALPRSDRYA